MYEAEGVGLAAPQVGVNKRLMVYNQSGDREIQTRACTVAVILACS